MASAREIPASVVDAAQLQGERRTSGEKQKKKENEKEREKRRKREKWMSTGVWAGYGLCRTEQGAGPVTDPQ